MLRGQDNCDTIESNDTGKPIRHDGTRGNADVRASNPRSTRGARSVGTGTGASVRDRAVVPVPRGRRQLRQHPGGHVLPADRDVAPVSGSGPGRDWVSAAGADVAPAASGGLSARTLQAVARGPRAGDRLPGVPDRARTTPGKEEPVSRAVLYMRVSSKEQLEGYSLEAQREAGIKYIADHGWELVDEYEDRAETARTARRKDFQRMLQELEDNRIDYLLVHKSDRFARNKLDHFVTKDLLKKRGVKLVSVTENFNDDTPQGRLVEGVMASINEYYSDNLGEEVKKGQRQKIRDGGWPSHAPIGYRNVRRDVGVRKAEAVLELDPIQAPLVLELCELYATGAYSERELYDYIVERGMRTRTGHPPARSAVHDMLTNPFY